MFSSLTYLTIIVATASLLIGLTLFILGYRKPNGRSYALIVTSWPFFALFMSIFIFLLFPGASASGTIFGISVTGAVALFMLIWWYGARVSYTALGLDSLIKRLEQEKQGLEGEVQELRRRKARSLDAKELPHAISRIYQLKEKRDKKIALITGRIEEVRDVDIWVNPENTDMQMARFYDLSISGVIRYYGALRSPNGRVTDDLVANELKSLLGNNAPVAPATVYVTEPGELKKENNVKKIFHVATVRGEVGIGYIPVENIQYCVIRALKEADSEMWKSLDIETILIPLLGTGTARGKVEEVVPRLIQAAISYFETTENSTIKCIYFLARTNVYRDACHTILRQFERSNKLVMVYDSN